MSFPFNHRSGPPLPKMTLWEAIVILWRETVTRPERPAPMTSHHHHTAQGNR